MGFQITTLRDKENTATYPRTLVEAICNSLGTPLSEILKDIEKNASKVYIQTIEPEVARYDEWLKPTNIIKISDTSSETTVILETSEYNNQKYAVEIEGNIYAVDALSEDQAEGAPNGSVILAETDVDNILK